MKGYSILNLVLILSFIQINCIKQTSQQNRNKVAQDLCHDLLYIQGAIVRGDTTQKKLSIVFTGGDYADGGFHIQNVLKTHETKASFFFTGDFYRNPEFNSMIKKLKEDGHYLGAHSDKHLLYCDWNKRDSLLVSKDEFLLDLRNNYKEMEKFGINENDAPYFLPSYEWYNGSISKWTLEAGFQLINFTNGTRSNADYTTPDMGSYRSGDEIYQSIVNYEGQDSSGLNGFILLIHIGTAPERADKFYHRLDELISWLKGKGYEPIKIDELLMPNELND